MTAVRIITVKLVIACIRKAIKTSYLFVTAAVVIAGIVIAVNLSFKGLIAFTSSFFELVIRVFVLYLTSTLQRTGRIVDQLPHSQPL